MRTMGKHESIDVSIKNNIVINESLHLYLIVSFHIVYFLPRLCVRFSTLDW